MFILVTKESMKDLKGVRAFGLTVEVLMLPMVGWGLLARCVPLELQDLMRSCGYIEFK